MPEDGGMRDHNSDALHDEKRMYSFVEEFARAKGLEQTLRALPYVLKMHEGQYRKGSRAVPYVVHPLMITCHAISLGLSDDDLLCAALLHDVCEDCNVPVQDLPAGDAVRSAVALVTKDFEALERSEDELAGYYGKISENRIACMVKILDRCNNISGMAAAFSADKMNEYIAETKYYIYPMMDMIAEKYPEYENAIFLIRYHMTSVIETVKHGFG